ncbi:MAG: 2,3-bisphosphoglycerate-independent phosphoglycerate mutase [Bradymonadia bacterium]|jgi:2,3-bisphosphoglycerate-independent phosphoglycerate mutase
MLKPLKKLAKADLEGPVFLIVLDGIGEGRGDESDAVHLARTPVFDLLDREAKRCSLFAHGTHVGMPSDADMGNSEVGHNAIGAGRVFSQGASLVEEAVKSERLFQSETWHWLRDGLKETGTLHFIGLLSDGNVHSHVSHLYAMIERADLEGICSVCVHPLLDGRDVGSTTALDYILPLEARLARINAKPGRNYRIASGGGRMNVTMDRYEADWSIVERGWSAHVRGEGRQFATAGEAITTYREENEGISDQQLPPFVIAKNGEPVGRILDGDSVVFFNFRGDRAIEISKAFELDDFSAFDRKVRPNVRFAGMMQYDGDTHLPKNFLVSPPAIDKTLGEYLAVTGLKQLAVAETQKYGHVTYFWNGNRSGYFNESLERYIEVPSDRVDFSERPWMKAAEVTDAVIEALNKDKYDFVRINYANGDMVGHTGNREATIIAVEAVNLALGRLLKKIKEIKGVAIITADHGNADEMYQWNKKTNDFIRDENGVPVELTSHTLNKVPCWFYDPAKQCDLQINDSLEPKRLSNLAASVLTLLGYEIPSEYEASLI